MVRVYIICTFLIISTLSACGNRKETADQNEPGVMPKEEKTSSQKAGNIVFFGNSLTAGFGLDPSEAFPAQIQAKIDSLQLPYKVVNAGLSGETSAGGKSRIDWILQQPIDVFVLELGANDGLRGIPVSETTSNLQSIIDHVKQKYPEAKLLLLGMEVPPNMGKKYATEFRSVFRDLAEKNNLPLVPFLLDGVGGVPQLNLPDGIHPTPEGHKIVAENIWKKLGPIL